MLISGFLTSDKVRDSPLKCITFANIIGESFTGDQTSCLVLCFLTDLKDYTNSDTKEGKTSLLVSEFLEKKPQLSYVKQIDFPFKLPNSVGS